MSWISENLKTFMTTKVLPALIGIGNGRKDAVAAAAVIVVVVVVVGGEDGEEDKCWLRILWQVYHQGLLLDEDPWVCGTAYPRASSYWSLAEGWGWPSPDRQHREGQGCHKHTQPTWPTTWTATKILSTSWQVEVLWFLPRETDGIKDTVVGRKGGRVRTALRCHIRRHWNVYRKWQPQSTLPTLAN